MLFYTRSFLVFALCLLVALACLRGAAGRKLVLLAASYVFYMWWNPAFVLLLLFSTCLDYVVGLLMGEQQSQRRRTALLVFSLVTQLGLLGYFKYADFFVRNGVALLADLGIHAQVQAPGVTLPVGISFYTFQTMSYTIDVYRGKLPPSRSFLDFALFIAFFPHLVAGPIIKAAQFLPQLSRRVTVNLDRYALFLILRGLTKKVLIADNIAVLPDLVFADPGRWGSVVIWSSTVAFAVQIYCDFSGYSDIAIGILRVFGFHVPLNFDRPYFARNPADFWHRWHISLSSWLRDYLYVPLGGNRGGRVATYRNLLITMTLGGLWHGASWNFVLWGVFHGVLLVGHRAFTELRPPRATETSPQSARLRWVASVLATQYVVLVSWIMFRVRDLGDMAVALRKFVFFDFRLDFLNRGLNRASFFFVLALLLVFLLVHVYSYARQGIDHMLAQSSLPTVAVTALSAGVLFYAFWPLRQAPFIYFQF